MFRLFIALTLLSQLCLSQDALKFIHLGSRKQAEVERLTIDIEVIDDLTYTTINAKFYNPHHRNQEGEMILPLPDGATVCDYKLEVNGMMEDASVVLKEKALKAYEEIKARNVDPGIVEKKKDAYKIRVFPVLPRKSKSMSISYVTKSKAENGHYHYKLPLQLSNLVNEVSIKILAPESKLKSENLKLNTTGLPVTLDSGSFKDFISLRTPVSKNNTVIIEQQKGTKDITNYYKVFIPDSLPLQKKYLPENITILWDGSSNLEKSILDKQLELLDRYFQINKNTNIKLYSAGYELADLGIFKINNGDWSKLKKQIQKIQHDGALDYHCVKAIKREDLDHPLFGFFRYNQYKLLSLPITQSSQHSVDLHHFSIDQNLKSIAQQRLIPMIEEKNFLGSFDTEVNSKCLQFVCKGISQNSEVDFCYEYDNQSVYKTKVNKNTKQFRLHNSSVSKSIAQHILNQLIRQKHPESVISNYAISHGLVSDYTSMIVLETLEDYVKYEIPPSDPKILARYKTLLEQTKRPLSTGTTKEKYHAINHPWHNYPIKEAIRNIDIWKNSIHRFFLEEQYDVKSYEQVMSWKDKIKASATNLNKITTQKEFIKAAKIIGELDKERQKFYYIPSQYPKDKNIHVSLRGLVKDPKTHLIKSGTDLKEFVLSEDLPFIDVYRNAQRVTYNLSSAQYKKTPLQSGDMLVAKIDHIQWTRYSSNLADQPYIIDPGTNLSLNYLMSYPYLLGGGGVGGDDPFAESIATKPSSTKRKAKNATPIKKHQGIQNEQWLVFANQINNTPENAYSHYLSLKSDTKKDIHFYLKVAEIFYQNKLYVQARKVLSNIMAGEESSTVAQKRYILWLMHFKDYQHAVLFIKKIDPELNNMDFKFMMLNSLHQLGKLTKKEAAEISLGLNHSFDKAQIAEKPMYDLRVLATAESNGISNFIKIKYAPTDGIDLKLSNLSRHGLYSDVLDGLEEHSMKQAIPGTYKIKLANDLIATYRVEIHCKQPDGQTGIKVVTVHTDGSGGWKDIGNCEFKLP